MQTINQNEQVIFSNEKFGFITEKQIVIKKGQQDEKINIDAIKGVNLIKKRVFYLNLTLFILSISLFINVYQNFNNNQIEKHFLPFSIGLTMLFYSFLHKFYYYRIVIKEKNNNTHELLTTQFRRKCIKKFYYSIMERLPIKNNNDLFR